MCRGKVRFNQTFLNDLTNLSHLNLSGNQLQSLNEDVFDGLANLSTLALYDNQLQLLNEDIFDGLINLDTIDLWNNQLQSLPADIFDGLTNLSTLVLYGNPFNEGLPLALIEWMKTFGGTLYIDAVAVNDALPAQLELVTGDTETVYLENAFSASLFDTHNSASAYTVSVVNKSIATAEIAGAHTLIITAVGNGETTIEVVGLFSFDRVIQTLTVAVSGESVCDRTPPVRDEIVAETGVACGQVTAEQLAQITILDLSYQSVTQLQSGDFSGLTNLEALHLNDAGNVLEILPADIFDGLTNLEDLGLEGNGLETLPANIFDDLTKLSTLNLSDNPLQLNEDIFDGLTELQYLSLQDNQMQIPPADIFGGLTNLKELVLSGNQLQSLDENVFNGLTNLNKLLLWDNQLQTLPADIFDGLTNLEHLDLEDNELRMLPADVFDALTNFRFLNLSENQLQLLPADIFDSLTNLEMLYLWDNQMQTLPASLFDDTANLSHLDLEDNPFSEGLPPALIEWMKTFVESGDELYLDIVAVNDVLSTRLELVLGDTENVDLENAFFSAYEHTHSPASAYTVSAANQLIATAELTGAHTLTITAVGAGETTVKVIGADSDGNTAAQTLTVTVRSICDRTQQVRDAIVAAALVTACGQITTAHLAMITNLDLYSDDITQLQSGDFNGLTNLEFLNLGSNELQTLPAGIFDSSTKLEVLNLAGNSLSSGLSSAVIERLASVTTVTLNLVAVNDALPPLRMPVGSTKTVSLEDAFFYADASSRGSASTYKITVTEETVATVTETSTHTLMIMALEEGKTEIEVVGFHIGQRATQTFTVTVANNIIFRIKVFLQGAQ